MSTKFTLEDVSKKSSDKGGLIIINKLVYDITDFMPKHPGGDDILVEVLGQDATEAFHEVRHSAEAIEELKGLQVGELETTTAAVVTKPPLRISAFSLISAAGAIMISVGAVLLRNQVENPLRAASEE